MNFQGGKFKESGRSLKHPKFTERKAAVKQAKGLSMPRILSQWELLANQNDANLKTDTLKFKYKSEWFWVFEMFEDESELRFEKDRVGCKFQLRNDAVNCTVIQGDEASAPLVSGFISPVQGAGQPGVGKNLPGRQNGLRTIPVSTTGHEITDAGLTFLKCDHEACFIDVSDGLFSLPSLSVKVLALAEEMYTPKYVSFSRGCTLIQPDQTRIRVKSNGV